MEAAQSGGLAGAAVAAERPRWELPTDEGGMEKLGQTMTTILQLSDILTSYFTISGISLLLMVARSLKMVDFQRHLDLTVRTLSRSSLDLLHFLIIFFISLFLSTMIGHVMLGTTEEALSSFDKGFNFHFEMMLGSSLDVVGRLFSDRSVVRGNEEYATLCVYSFAVPAYLLFVLLNEILGIVGDAFGEEKENLGELDEPTLLDDLTMAVSYRYGRIMGAHPS
jgi:Polycystin cation channel.